MRGPRRGPVAELADRDAGRVQALRVGILGGTFNPPHIGHLICAQEAHWQLDLATVTFMPVGEAPHKEVEQDVGREARYELCRVATAEDERLTVSRHEIEKQGPAYTVDTLRALRQAATGDELVFIMGGDQAAGLKHWREPEDVLRLAQVAVAERDETRRERIRSALAGFEGADRLTFFSMPRIDVSSTMVRHRIRSGRPIRYLVPDAVADYIERTELYRDGDGS